MFVELTETIIKKIVKEPDMVSVKEFETDEEYIECKAVCRLHQGVEPHLEQ